MNNEEKQFGIIAIKLGFITKQEFIEVVNQKKIDKDNNSNKHIAKYLFENKKLNREQITNILAIIKENSATNNLTPKENEEENTPSENLTTSDNNSSDNIAIANNDPNYFSTNKFKTSYIKLFILLVIIASSIYYYFIFESKLSPEQSRIKLNALGYKFEDDDFSDIILKKDKIAFDYFIIAKPNVSTLNKGLLIASEKGLISYVEILLKSGANPNFTKSEEENDTPLSIASYNGYAKTVELLLKYKANINYNNGKALQKASEKDIVKIVEFLIKNRANCGYKEAILLNLHTPNKTCLNTLLPESLKYLKNDDYQNIFKKYLEIYFSSEKTLNENLMKFYINNIKTNFLEEALVYSVDNNSFRLCKDLLDYDPNIELVKKEIINSLSRTRNQVLFYSFNLNRFGSPFKYKIGETTGTITEEENEATRAQYTAIEELLQPYLKPE